MMRKRTLILGLGLVASITALAYASEALDDLSAQNVGTEGMAPLFEVDPFWPKPLPNHWILGSAVGVVVDSLGKPSIAGRQWMTGVPILFAGQQRGVVMRDLLVV